MRAVAQRLGARGPAPAKRDDVPPDEQLVSVLANERDGAANDERSAAVRGHGGGSFAHAATVPVRRVRETPDLVARRGPLARWADHGAERTPACRALMFVAPGPAFVGG
jgi:hypothetical protein